MGQIDAQGEGGEAALLGGFPFSFGILIEAFEAISRDVLGDAKVGCGGCFGLGREGFGQPVDLVANDLADAFRRAEAAHGKYEAARLGGQRDANWPEWYARYMVAEQAGTELPS